MKNKQLELDPELEAVGQIALVLRPFDKDARERIVRTLNVWMESAPEPVKRGRKPKEAASGG
jgi:hypothetical protein